MSLPSKPIKDAIQKVTGSGIGDRTQVFLRGVAWTFSGAFIARILSGLSTLYITYCLGPAAFGEASLALAASLPIMVPLLCGLPTALIHYLPAVPREERSRWSSTSLLLLTITIVGTLGLSALFNPLLSRWLGITPRVMSWALYYCAGFAVYTASISWLSAEEKFSTRARVEIAFATVFMLFIVALRLLKSVSAAHYIHGFFFAYLVIGLCVLYREKAQFGDLGEWTETIRISKKLLSYGLVFALGGVSSALLLSPARLIANRDLNLTDVGLLSVYQGGAIQIASFFHTIIAQVLFPIASRTPNKAALKKKMNQAILITAVPCLIGLFSLLTLYFHLLSRNKHYSYDWSNAAIYSCAAYLSFVFGIVAWFYAAIGKRGVLAQCFASLVSGTINLAACWLLIPRLHIFGAGLAYAVGALAGIILLYIPALERWSGAGH